MEGQYRIEISGISPIIMRNGAAGLDTRSAANLEIAEISRKKGSNRTVADDARLAELECTVSFWLKGEAPAIPEGAIRAMIEESARKLKQGPQVRGGLMVIDSTFHYDTERYGTTLEKLIENCQFTVPVKVGQARVLRTRAKFDQPWSCVFTVDTDPELVDEIQLSQWLDIGGMRIGLGDWRPSKSGHYGRFKTVAIKELE